MNCYLRVSDSDRSAQRFIDSLTGSALGNCNTVTNSPTCPTLFVILITEMSRRTGTKYFPVLGDGDLALYRRPYLPFSHARPEAASGGLRGSYCARPRRSHWPVSLVRC